MELGCKFFPLCSYNFANLYYHWQELISEDSETHGSTFVPVILGSDKTTVSVTTGKNEYYSLYMSIGNVHNNVRHAHRDALTVVRFLTMPKSEHLWRYYTTNC